MMLLQLLILCFPGGKGGPFGFIPESKTQLHFTPLLSSKGRKQQSEADASPAVRTLNRSRRDFPALTFNIKPTLNHSEHLHRVATAAAKREAVTSSGVHRGQSSGPAAGSSSLQLLSCSFSLGLVCSRKLRRVRGD